MMASSFTSRILGEDYSGCRASGDGRVEAHTREPMGSSRFTEERRRRLCEHKYRDPDVFLLLWLAQQRTDVQQKGLGISISLLTVENEPLSFNVFRLCKIDHELLYEEGFSRAFVCVLCT